MKSHEENRSLVCALCLSKTRVMRPITPPIKAIIVSHFLNDFDTRTSYYPTVLCITCRVVCGQYASENYTRSIQLHEYRYNKSLQTRANAMCCCEICQASRVSNGINLPGFQRPKLKRGRPRTDDNDKNEVMRMCKKCCSQIGKGKRHVCSKSERISNLLSILEDERDVQRTGEAVVSTFLKNKLKETDSETIELPNRRGKPSTFNHEVPSRSRITRSMTVSGESLFKLKTENNLSLRKTLNVAKSFRKLGVSFETGIKEKLPTLNKQLNKFFDVTEIKTEGERKDDVVTTVPVVYCKDVPGLITHIKEARNISDEDLLIKIGIDGGGGSFKITISVLSTNQATEGSFKDSGVKRLMILALAPKLSEKYENVFPIWKTLLRLHEIDAVVAGDLKIINIIIGIMAHSSAHPCSYCDTAKKELGTQNGNERTIGNIRENYKKWMEAKGIAAKNFDNCVHDPLVYGPDEHTILRACPPPPLHLTLGIVNVIYKSIESVNREWADLLVSKAGVRHQQQTFGFTGRACHKLLESASVLKDIPELKSHVEILENFKTVYTSCFSEDLMKEYESAIDHFTGNWEALKLPHTPKFHIVKYHVKEFCRITRKGLGIFGEQASETVHSDFLTTWERYKAPPSSNTYKKQLLNSVVDYNSGHLV